MSAAPPPQQHIVLIGLMGTGKTTVGRLLAAKLGLPLADSDSEIEAREGVTVRELQERFGAPWLRPRQGLEQDRRLEHRLEATILLEALARAQPSVIAAAASTIDDERCREALRGPGVVAVWLEAKLATLVARYDSDPHRPRYGEGTAAALTRQLAARGEHFAQTATVAIEVDGLEPEAVLEALDAAIGRWPV
jgi:shikimate kinase